MLFDVSCDMDGVLADTEDASRRAYASVGVSVPDGAWGAPVSAWLQDEELHAAKQAKYPRFLQMYARPLIGRTVVEMLRDSGLRVCINTNASPPTAFAVLAWLRLEVDGLICQRKLETLNTVEFACHIDDQEVISPVPLIRFNDDPRAASVLAEVKRYV